MAYWKKGKSWKNIEKLIHELGVCIPNERWAQFMRRKVLVPRKKGRCKTTKLYEEREVLRGRTLVARKGVLVKELEVLGAGDGSFRNSYLLEKAETN
ncbi:hypothetical protein GOBAR_DD19954 [Gossypium barbadense]|nr:hypothetical protein GOBAR_DD19954 [Gossypium barbadense]